MSDWDGDDYQAKFDRLSAEGDNVHGEVDFVMAYGPTTVLDAGCGTGRVAIELARRGISVVGVDFATAMLDTARARAPELEWIERDLSELDLRSNEGEQRTFSAVVMAGNVMLFTPDPPSTVAGCARHLDAGGLLIAGFQVEARLTPSGHPVQSYSLDQYDDACTAAGLVPAERFATWDRERYGGGDYAVSVHRVPLHSEYSHAH